MSELKVNKETVKLLNIAGSPKSPEPLYSLTGELPVNESSSLKKRSVDESKSTDESKLNKANASRVENFRLLWTLPPDCTNIKEISRVLAAYMLKTKKRVSDFWSIACLINGLSFVGKNGAEYNKVRNTFDLLSNANSYLLSDNPEVWLLWHSACKDNGVNYVFKSDPLYEKVKSDFTAKLDEKKSKENNK